MALFGKSGPGGRRGSPAEKFPCFLAGLALALALAGCGGGAPRLGGGESPVPTATAPLKMEETAPPSTPEPMPPSEPVSAPEPKPEPADEDFVRVLDYIPTLYVELKYASEDNFTGQVLYDFTEATLRYGTVKKLMAVQAVLEAQGYSLKIWDAYRPVSSQFKLWEACPDPAYVANPNTGYSSHSRGNTLDATLALTDGTPVEMPSGFDDFSHLADRDYSDVSAAAATGAALLERAMEDGGFKGYSGEWWHYSDTDDYPVAEG